jgi:hypothetical protein
MKYVVTDTAPPRVAGRRVKAGDTIELTDKAARYELTACHIKPLLEETSNPVETVVETPSKGKAKS